MCIRLSFQKKVQTPRLWHKKGPEKGLTYSIVQYPRMFEPIKQLQLLRDGSKTCHVMGHDCLTPKNECKFKVSILVCWITGSC
jgi:hypothetical protein